MIAGRPPLSSPTTHMAVIRRHLRDATQLDAVAPDTTPAIAHLIRHCLDKDAKRCPPTPPKFSPRSRRCATAPPR
jgi:hypothetical protein